MQNYANIILPLNVGIYTYKVPQQMQGQVSAGMRVLVPLGRNRKYIGIVHSLTSEVKEGINYRDILQVLDDEPIVSQYQLELWQWVAEYYCCSLSDVMKNALPSALSKNTLTELKDAYVVKTDVLPKRNTSQALSILARYDELAISGNVLKSTLLENESISAFNTLVKNGVFTLEYKKKSRLKTIFSTKSASELTSAQSQALEEIKAGFLENKPVLLNGVTSSGKTEIYIKLIQEVIEKGGQVLYLVPEIALTTQLTDRLSQVFGDDLISYHSKLSDSERGEIYNEIGSRFKVVLGVRSAVFLPFTNLKLIIVDEEHEPSYKQTEPAPRYNAKNVALMLAHKLKIGILMGSATPSVESYHLTKTGKYKLVNLNVRYGNVELPEIIVLDRQDAFIKNRMKSMFSWLLLEKMKECLSKGEQVILFQNRRGFSSFIECKQCAWVPKCPHCDVSLTYHKYQNYLSCHYCGYKIPVPNTCPKCGTEDFKDKGFGTEKVIEELEERFPDYKAGRLDTDVTQSKHAYNKILNAFSSGEIKILVGTQMVAKGLDFDNVGLVGVLNADNMLNYPDFRSDERAFQILVQVSGRAGRRNKRGLVLIQTAQTEHSIMPAIIQNDYSLFYDKQIMLRQMFSYPPFVRIINIYVKSSDYNICYRAVGSLYKDLFANFGDQLLGPDKPPVSKVQKLHIQKLMLKLPVEQSMSESKRRIIKSIEKLKTNFPSVFVIIDVDPI
ncbi:MAG: primosomal protein N' [Paludibacteraceae bacterium]|nr:primosomal protein N' [Paludibacteraceae bacterium]